MGTAHSSGCHPKECTKVAAALAKAAPWVVPLIIPRVIPRQSSHEGEGPRREGDGKGPGRVCLVWPDWPGHKGQREAMLASLHSQGPSCHAQ